MNLERKEKGSQFKVVDPARRPVKPIKPDFLKMMVLCLIIGCAFGGGIAISMEMLDSSFRDPVHLEELVGVEVLCTVPRLSLVKETTKRRIWTTLGATLIIALATALAVAFIFFWKQGRIIF